MKETIIYLPYLTAGLNGKDGLIRQHFHAAKKVKDKILFDILSQKPEKRKMAKCQILYVRYCKRYSDWDNAYASFKHIGDALKKAGIILDDSPNCVAELICRQRKGKEQRTEIYITEIPF